MNPTFYISLVLFGTTLAIPTLYKDRQDGQTNGQLSLDDISFLIIPPTKMLEEVFQMFSRQSAKPVPPAEGQSKQLDPQNSPYTVELSSSHAEEAKPSDEQVVRIPASHVHEKPEEEDKKKVQEPVKKIVEKKKVEDSVKKVVEEPKKKAEDLKKKVEDGVKKVVEVPKRKVEAVEEPKKKVEDGVKKIVEEPKKKVEDGVKKIVEDSKKKVEDQKKKVEEEADKKIDDGKKKMKMEEEEVLSLIQSGIEECGPDGKRDPQGICVYTPIKA